MFFCDLTRFEPGIFSDLTNLQEVQLGRNELVEIDEDLFINLRPDLFIYS